MENTKTHEIIIIGSGPAGLTSAIYTGRAELSPIILGGQEWGGQLMGTSEVENFPGFPEGVMGPQLMMNMLKQAQKYGADMRYETVTRIDFSNDIKKVYVGDKEYKAKAVIIALGSSPRRLNIPGENEFWGKGVSACATCDAALYRGKIATVIGGGDTAMEEASFISKFASKVYIIYRKDTFPASQVMQERVLNNEKIEILWNTEVKEVKGDGIVNSLKLINNKSNTSSSLKTDGMFLAIGHSPNVSIIGDTLDKDEKGFITTINHTKTSVDGVFVAGDVYDHEYQQAITAAAMGCMAALDAERWLASK